MEDTELGTQSAHSCQDNDWFRKRIAELEKRNSELKELNDATVHILSTPIENIEVYCNTLLTDELIESNAEVKHHVERILHFSNQSKTLLTDLINLSCSASRELQQQKICISSLAHNIMAELSETTVQRQFELTVQPDLTIEADPLLIRILLINLLSNAWKYTAKEPITRIKLEAVESKNKIELIIRDNGIGFDSRWGDRLFDLFSRFCEDPEFEGSGIGLATAKRIVKRHGGEIWANGSPGRGAAFHITLPIRPV